MTVIGNDDKMEKAKNAESRIGTNDRHRGPSGKYEEIIMATVSSLLSAYFLRQTTPYTRYTIIQRRWEVTRTVRSPSSPYVRSL